MEKENQIKKKGKSKPKNTPSKKKEEATLKKEEEERNGIIPEGMDFKKFLGCGG